MELGQRLLRPSTVIIATALGLALAVLGAPQAAAPIGLAASEAEARPCPSPRANPGTIGVARAARSVACLINRRRVERGLPRLEQRGRLRHVAKQHSQRMVNKGCFASICPGEKSLLGRLRDVGYLPCNCDFGVHQAIAGGAGPRGRPIRIVRSWIRSKQTRKVIFNRTFQHIGVGTVWGAPGAPAKDHYGTYTAIFGYKR